MTKETKNESIVDAIRASAGIVTKQGEYAKLAQMAYLSPGQSNAPEFERAKFIESDNAEAWIFFTPEATVISCRGTEPSQIKDITADLKFWRIDPAGTGEKIHSGFWSEAFSLFPKVIKNLPDDEKPIAVTGHSLGGAMAVIMTGFLLKSGYNVKELYTYGQPRVGNKKFCDRITRDCDWQRFINNNDIVPRVPLKMGWVFHDGGNLNYINSYGNVGDLTWWQSIKDSWRGHTSAWKKKQWFDSFYDHSALLYRRLLNNEYE